MNTAKIALFSLLLLPTFAQAGTSKVITVTCKVLSFDSAKVILECDKEEYSINRAYIDEKYKLLKPSKIITIEDTPEQIKKVLIPLKKRKVR